MCSNIPYIDPQAQFDHAVMSNVLMTLTGLGVWNEHSGITPAWKALAKTWCGNVDAVAVGFAPQWTSPVKGYEATKEILQVLAEVLEE
jgi:hypothetical protein